jgi:hypothetical protein
VLSVNYYVMDLYDMGYPSSGDGGVETDMEDTSLNPSSSEVLHSSSSDGDILGGSGISLRPTALSALGRMIFFGDRVENETVVWAVTRKSLVMSSSSEMNHDDDSGEGSGGHGILDAAASMAASVVSGMVDINNSQGETGHLGGVADDMNDTVTVSYWPVRDPLYITIPITVIYIIILILGLLGNVTTCIVIIRSRYLHTTTNYYLFSLAVSDLLLLLSGLPAEMHSIWRRYPGRKTTCFAPFFHLDNTL